MANKMLIDATHPEETRVVVLRGNRVEEFDFETAQRKQLRGNIYLAKVTRVEPSLQAAFVDYGGNRHGFLAFSEIHPDYYQIPVADRQALIDEEGRAQRAADDEDDRRSRRHRGRGRPHPARRDSEVVRGELAETSAGAAAGGDEHDFTHTASDGDHHADDHAGTAEHLAAEHETEDHEAAVHEVAGSQASFEPQRPPELPPPIPGEALSGESGHGIFGDSHTAAHEATGPGEENPESAEAARYEGGEGETAEDGRHEDANGETGSSPRETAEAGEGGENGEDDEAAEEIVESVGGSDALEEVPDRAPRHRRQYKIQEVIKRRQVMLVQVVKEERGTKGAALTTYLSLAGRYSVLMPNTARGGGISRKITSGEDRSRLKEIAGELEVPEGMGVIVRTAGASRTKTEIKRDFEYLLRLWETVRDLTLKSTAPKLVYEEGSLVKRSIRDLYSKDIDEVIVAGPDSYHEAKDFMRMLMPSHAKNVKLYADTQPLLSRYGVENQLDGMFSPVVQLRSGGYIVLNQAEALVAIDVNSGRATREHHIEDTALKTNLEAADEIARQLRLRDLAGLVVIDFIDMDEKRNNRSVERRLKECLKHDRARIQVGRISHFGLLEMSRQRIRSSVLESSTEKCPYCGGSGHVRSVSSLALQVLRALEEQLMKGATHNLIARTRPDVALYVLNQKRAHLRALEERFAITITISADTTLVAPQAFIIDRGEQVHTIEAARARAEQTEAAIVPLEEEDELEDISGETADEIEETEDLAAEEPAADVAEEQDEGGAPPRRRRRRRRGRNGGGEAHALAQQPRHDDFAEPAGEPSAPNDGDLPGDEHAKEAGPNGSFSKDDTQRDGERRRRRRGRRGGRRNRPERTGEGAPVSQDQEHHEPQDFQPQESQPQDFQRRDFQPGTDLPGAQATTEAELAYAVADLDGVPPAPAPRTAGPADIPAHTAASPSAPPVAAEPPVQQPEPPRRRSTVREPAPVVNAAEAPQSAPAPASPPTPAPQPVITELGDSESTDRPRRSGWWSRRFAGG